VPFSNEIVPAVWHYSVDWARLQTRTRPGSFAAIGFDGYAGNSSLANKAFAP
jgi:hypothetical protein